jgi:hypothetical protein
MIGNAFRLRGNFRIWKVVLLFQISAIPALVEAQEFKRHGLKENTLTAHQWRLEPFVHVLKNGASDWDYEDVDVKGPFLIGGGLKITLKNNITRGIGFGAGIDYATTGYLRLNALLDLDFLLHIKSPDGKLGESLLNRLSFTSILGSKDGKNVKELTLILAALFLSKGINAQRLSSGISLTTPLAGFVHFEENYYNPINTMSIYFVHGPGQEDKRKTFFSPLGLGGKWYKTFGLGAGFQLKLDYSRFNLRLGYQVLFNSAPVRLNHFE